MNRKNDTPLKLALIAVICFGILLTSGVFGATVEVVNPVRGDIVKWVEENGDVQACNSTEVYASQAARIVSVPVSVGQSVQKGQVLVIMENYDLDIQKANASAQIAEANAAASSVLENIASTRVELKEAEIDLERARALLAAGAVSESEYAKARLKVNSLKQLLAQQQASLKNYREQAASAARVLQSITGKAQELVVVSPTSGVVLRLPAKPHQVVMAGSLLASVGTPDLLEVKVDILEDEMTDVEVGQEARITSPVLGSQVLQGAVKQIYPAAEEKVSTLGVIQRRVPVIVSLTETANLKPGYEVHVAIKTVNRRNVLTIPLEAVRTLENGSKQCMVVEYGHIRYRTIKTGISDKSKIEVIKGLKVTDMVVRDGSQKLNEWEKVKPKLVKW